MYRRDILKGVISAIACSALPAGISAASATNRLPWKNWSGNQTCTPQFRHAPQSHDELEKILKSSSNKIRAVGAGHSFSGLVPTNDTLISMRGFSGVSTSPSNSLLADIGGGSTLKEIGPLLEQEGQALSNMPDIDYQTLAGSISTATHGTGRELGSLSSYVTEFDLMTAQGEMLTCSKNENSDVFYAGKVGLGALGLITRVQMNNRPSFRLLRQAQWHTYEDGMAAALENAKKHRNYEFYVIPFTSMILSDSLDESTLTVSPAEEIDGNQGLLDLKMARDYLGWSDKLRELVLNGIMSTIEPESNVDQSYKIYATERTVRFNEMEYHLPEESGLQALNEVKHVIEHEFPEVFFPIECRFVNADDAWLSPFYQRRSISIAVHRYFKEDYQAMFKRIEPIFQSYGGRPHWGKVNTFNAQQFSEQLPKWNDFKRVRKELDPKGRFLNNYLNKLFT